MLARVLTAVTLLLALTLGAWRETAARSAASSSPPYLCLIVIDGFRPDYLTLAPMRHLRALMSQGRWYDNSWVGQLEAETPASHATIVTGVYPKKHGIIGFGWRTPDSGAFTFMPTNVGMIAAGDLAHVMEQSGVPTISNLVHARNRHDITVSLSGEKLWASAPMGTGADYLLYGKELPVAGGQIKFRPVTVGPNVPPARTGFAGVTAPSAAFAYQDSFAARLAVKLLDTLRPRALFVNLPATDIAGHYNGGMAQPKAMAEIVKGTDYAIGKVMAEYKRLGIYDRTVFVVVSDHGMVTGRHRVAIHSIYNAVKKAPVQQLEQALLSSIGAIWLRDPQNAGTLAKILAGDHFAGVEGALYKVPIEGGSGQPAQGSFKFVAEDSTAKRLPAAVLRAYLDLADTEASVSGADLLLPYRENTTGLPLTKSFQGMHGGFSWGSQHNLLVIAGPGVKPGLSHFASKLVDVAPTVERLLGLTIPNGLDGVVLADALEDATPAERSAQQAIAPSRAANAKAIRLHSAGQK
jgi:arylsulfatase A-like enzyme